MEAGAGGGEKARETGRPRVTLGLSCRRGTLLSSSIHLPPRPPAAGVLVRGCTVLSQGGRLASADLDLWGLLTRSPTPPVLPSWLLRPLSPGRLSRAPSQGTPGQGEGPGWGARHTRCHVALLLTCAGTGAGRSGALASGPSSIKRGQRVLPDVSGPGGKTLSLTAQLGGSLASLRAAVGEALEVGQGLACFSPHLTPVLRPPDRRSEPLRLLGADAQEREGPGGRGGCQVGPGGLPRRLSGALSGRLRLSSAAGVRFPGASAVRVACETGDLEAWSPSASEPGGGGWGVNKEAFSGGSGCSGRGKAVCPCPQASRKAAMERGCPGRGARRWQGLEGGWASGRRNRSLWDARGVWWSILGHGSARFTLRLVAGGRRGDTGRAGGEQRARGHLLASGLPAAAQLL